MPSFDIVSEVDKQEIDNALNQARKELATRFDLKDAKTEIIPEPDKIVLVADDGAHLKALREIVIAKLSRRGVDLRNIEQGKENFSFDIMYAIVGYYDMLPLSRFWAYAEIK